MVLTNEHLYSKDVDVMSLKEKDEVIFRLREQVQLIQDQKNSYKKLSSDLELAYDHIKQLYDDQRDKYENMKDENQMLSNEISSLRFEVQYIRDEINQLQQKRIQTIFPESLSNIPINEQNEEISSSVIEQSLIQRKMSESLNIGGSINQKNQEFRETNCEQCEKIELDTLQNQQFSQNIQIALTSAQQRPTQLLPHQISGEDNKFRLNAKVGEMLFQDFLLIGPSLEEINGNCAIGEGKINAQSQSSTFIHQTSGSQQTQQGINISGQIQNIVGSAQGDMGEEVIFSQSILIDLVENKLDESQKEVVSKHAFPFQVKCKKYRVKRYESFMQDVYKNVFTENKVKDVKQFVFTIEGEQIFMPKGAPKQKDPPVLEGSNPNRRQYCIFFAWDDYIFNNKDKALLFKCPFAFCFITYYPFFTFFREVLCHMLAKLHKERIPFFNIHTKIQQQSFLQLDVNWIISAFEKETSIYKRKLLQLQLIRPEIQQIIHFSMEEEEENLYSSTTFQHANSESVSLQNGEPRGDTGAHKIEKSNSLKQTIQGAEQYAANVSFMVPNYRQLRLLETSEHSGANLILELLTFEDFWFILTLVMLEQQIVFFSQDILKVASALQTFASLYKPFNRSMLIFHIFEGRLTLLETPPPFLGGINQGFKYIMQNKLITEDCMRVNFIDLDTRRFYLGQDTLDLFEGSKAYMNYTKYGYQLRKTYSILTHSQYSLQQSFEFNDHKFQKKYNQIMFRSPPIQKEDRPKKVQPQAQADHTLNSQAQRVLELQKMQYSTYIKDLKVKALEEIYDLLELTFNYYILAHLPKQPTLDVYSKNFSPLKLQEKMLKRAEEKQFTALFLQTQNFQYFFQQYYENLWNSKPNTASTNANSLPNTAPKNAS